MRTIIKYLFWIIFLLLIWYILYLFVQKNNNQQLINSTTNSVVSQLKSVRFLETSQMTITKIIQWEDIKDSINYSEIIWKIKEILFEDKMILQVEWIVSAGFDMDKINTGSIKINNDNSVTIILPKPQIIHASLTENTKPYDRRLWIFTKWNIELESQLRNKAIEIIKDDAIKAWILDEAKISAKEALKILLEYINIKIREVNIEDM